MIFTVGQAPGLCATQVPPMDAFHWQYFSRPLSATYGNTWPLACHTGITWN